MVQQNTRASVLSRIFIALVFAMQDSISSHLLPE